LPDRASNPYSTHVPILLAAARWWPVREVLEFGCGDFSTRAFLNRRCFKELERVESYENDPEWAERIRQELGADPRLRLHPVNGAIADSVSRINLEEFDLVFVDDSTSTAERSATIQAVAAKRPQRPVVVVHDFEQLEYRRAAKLFKHRCRFTGLNPNTGVLWNQARLHRRPMRTLDLKLRKSGENSSIEEWRSMLAMLGLPE
jgi:hypothetical protein